MTHRLKICLSPGAEIGLNAGSHPSSGFLDDDEAVPGRERSFGYWVSIEDCWSLSPLLVRSTKAPRACASLDAPVVVTGAAQPAMTQLKFAAIVS